MARPTFPFELFIGLRYLRSPGNRTNLSLFVWIGVGGVFLGVTALIVVLAVMTGFQDGIKEKIISANPHILVLDVSGRGIGEFQPLAHRLGRVRGVKSATAFVIQQALFTVRAGEGTGGLIRGIDLSRPEVRADLARQLTMGALDDLSQPGTTPGIALGRELARTLGVIPGETVTVISPHGAMTAVGMVPKMRRFRVAGIFEAGMFEHDASLGYAPLWAAQEFAGLGDRVTGIEIKLDDPFEAKAVGKAIAARLEPTYWVRDWMEMNRNFFAALQLEKLALFVIVTIIVLVAAFAIIGHLVLLVAEKRKEIGILKAMGAPPGSIATIFLAVGILIGLVGTAAGSLAGWGLIWLQNSFKIIQLAPDVYLIDHLPMRLTGLDFALVIGATLLISLLATLPPARRAAALEPAEVLRYE